MSSVDKKIHFIWLGKTIETKKIELILRHVFLNGTNYEVILWTDKHKNNCMEFWPYLSEANNHRIIEGEKQPYHIQDLSTLEFHVKGHERPIFIPSGLQRHMLSGTKKLHIRDVKTLLECCGEPLRKYYGNSLRERNYGRASDILRVAALRLSGGIYLDVDVDFKTPLPDEIYAPEGLLVGTEQADSDGIITNAVLASPQNSPAIQSLQDAMIGRFNLFQSRGWWDRINDDLNNARQDLKEKEVALDNARSRFSCALPRFRILGMLNSRWSRPTAQQLAREDLWSAKKKFQLQMMASTSSVSGPHFLENFFYSVLFNGDMIRQAQTLGSETTRSTYISVLNKPVDGRSYMNFHQRDKVRVHNFRDLLKQSGIFDRIKFPTGHFSIGSEASWITNAE